MASMSAAPRRRRAPLRPMCAAPHACPRPVRMRVLAQVPVLAGLDTHQLGRIDDRMTALAWSEGEHLCTAGSPAEHLYVVAAGRVRTSRPGPGGHETVTDLLVPGELVGALDGLGSPHHSETATALTTTCALRLTVDDFRQVLLEHPAVALRVVETQSALLARSRAEVGRNARASVESRVASALLRLADKLGQERVSEPGALLQIPLTRNDLAGMTGSTAESVSRVMARLRHRDVIATGRRWTAVLDRTRLEQLATSDG